MNEQILTFAVHSNFNFMKDVRFAARCYFFLSIFRRILSRWWWNVWECTFWKAYYSCRVFDQRCHRITRERRHENIGLSTEGSGGKTRCLWSWDVPLWSCWWGFIVCFAGDCRSFVWRENEECLGWGFWYHYGYDDARYKGVCRVSLR